MPHLKRKCITRFATPDGKRCKSTTPGAVRTVTHSKKWYGYWSDGSGEHQVPLHASRSRSERMLEDLVEAGSEPTHLRQRRRPLSEHLEDFLASVANARRGKGKRPPAGVRIVRLRDRLTRALAALGWTRPADVDAASADRYLAGLLVPPSPRACPPGDRFTLSDVLSASGLGVRAVGRHVRARRLEVLGGKRSRVYPRATLEAILAVRRGTRGMGPTAVAAHAATLKRFAASVAAACALPANPLAGLACTPPPDGDGLHRRRALSRGESARLLAAAGASRAVLHGLDGPARRDLYALVLCTGLRKSEAAALTAACFRPDAAVPHVVIPATIDKRGVACEQPLPAACLPALRRRLRGLAPGDPVWPGAWVESAAPMLRADLEAAGIPYVAPSPLGDEHLDFHALRHSFVASLDRAGVTLKTAMRLARHSTPALTARVYGRASLEELGSAVAGLDPSRGG